MISSREFAAVPIILLCALLADALAQSHPEKAVKPEAKAVLDKARDTYRNLAGYHFERALLVQEAREDGKLASTSPLRKGPRRCRTSRRAARRGRCTTPGAAKSK